MDLGTTLVKKRSIEEISRSVQRHCDWLTGNRKEKEKQNSRASFMNSNGLLHRSLKLLQQLSIVWPFGAGGVRSPTCLICSTAGRGPYRIGALCRDFISDGARSRTLDREFRHTT